MLHSRLRYIQGLYYVVQTIMLFITHLLSSFFCHYFTLSPCCSNLFCRFPHDPKCS